MSAVSLTSLKTRRIAFVISSLDQGGAQKVLSLIANDLVAAENKVLIFTFSEKSGSYFPIDSRIEIRPLSLFKSSPGHFSKLKNFASRIRSLRRALQAADPSVIVSFMDRTNLLVLMATRGLRIPVIVCERSHPIKNLASKFLRIARWYIYGFADKVIFQTKSAQSQTALRNKDNTHVLPNPIQNLKTSRTESTQTIVGAGRLSFEKGFDILLEAFHQIATEFPTWKLKIYGDGEERENLKKLSSQLGLSNRVDFPGAKSSAEIYQNAEIFVLPSRYEGFPNSLAEAMAVGLTCVSSDCNFGPSDLIIHDQNGLLFQTTNPQQLAAALREVILNSEKRARFGREAARSVERLRPDIVLQDWRKTVYEAIRS